MKRKEVFSAFLIGAGIVSLIVIVVLFQQEVEAREELIIYLEGRIELTGERQTSDIIAGEFSSYIISENKGLKLDTNERIGGAQGEMKLGSISILDEGTYTFMVKQRNLRKEGYVYDNSVYSIEIEVYKQKNGRLGYFQKTWLNGTMVDTVTFHNTYYTPSEKQPALDIQVNKTSQMVQEGPRITQVVSVTNRGRVPTYGIRIREYMPEFARYFSHTGIGKYGVIAEKEHVTAMLPKLEVGECVTITITYQYNLCRSLHLDTEAVLLYEIVGAEYPTWTNDPKDPEHSFLL